MGFRVVCISRTSAAGGENVGHEVARRLGFRYVDEQIIERAAQRAQVDPALVAATEHRQPLLKPIQVWRSVSRAPRGKHQGLISTLMAITPFMRAIRRAIRIR
jgi:hypothetical protein